MSLIETLKLGVKNKQLVKYGKQSIDMQTANKMLIVYKFLGKENKKLFLRMADKNIPKLMDICWRC